jgi:MoaA/NifB/PqqE/SkfB family radical SAM enzyme
MTEEAYQDSPEDYESKEEAEKAFSSFRKTGKFLPCQYAPPSFFSHRLWIWSPMVDVDDIYTAAELCNSCPLKYACRKVGENEACGIWGGLHRDYWVSYRDVSGGDFPYR